ncbi:MAG: hypothetical protein LWX07_09200 [Bacteroidetes bacterium]|nr:hypothetical protein [Bacteroidota bacterium]
MINIEKIFAYKEIDSITPLLHGYEKKNKVVTFVPLNFVDKLTFDMAAAGAGIIGEYTVCSFRMKGVGTFRPGAKSNPFSGSRGKIAFEEEVRLEMECGEDRLESVIDALLESHPYDEPAYEIYEFRKRAKHPAGYKVVTRKKYSIKDILMRLNSKVEIFSGITDKKFSRFLIISDEIRPAHEFKAKENKIEAIISVDKLKYKIKLI